MMKLVLMLTAGAAMLGGPALAAVGAQSLHSGFKPDASAKAAKTWRFEARALAPQVPEQAALDPQGPTLIASTPAPDTPANRAGLGEPLSRSGRLTSPIGD
jgi:hypothetical protein